MTKVQIAAEMCRKWPDRGNLTLAKALYKAHPHVWTTVHAARLAVLRVRGAAGSHHRKHTADKSQYKKPGYAGQPLPEMPKSSAEEWKPFNLEARKTLILSDVHIPYHDGNALGVAVAFGVERNPDAVLLNGDICDFFAISLWLKDPRKVRLKEEIDATIQFLEYIRSRFPKAQIIWKHGNHEERWEHYLWTKAPELLDVDAFDFGAIFQLPRLGIELVKDQRIVMVGKLPVLHGHELPRGMTNPVNQARGQFLRTTECGLAGHGHRSSEHVEMTGFQKRLITNWSTGCICDLTPQYARVNRWNHGFAYVETDKAGAFKVQNRRIYNREAW